MNQNKKKSVLKQIFEEEKKYLQHSVKKEKAFSAF